MKVIIIKFRKVSELRFMLLKNITERRTAEAGLRQSKRDQAIGTGSGFNGRKEIRLLGLAKLMVITRQVLFTPADDTQYVISRCDICFPGNEPHKISHDECDSFLATTMVLEKSGLSFV